MRSSKDISPFEELTHRAGRALQYMTGAQLSALIGGTSQVVGFNPFFAELGIVDGRRDSRTFGQPVPGIRMGRCGSHGQLPWNFDEANYHVAGLCRSLNSKAIGTLEGGKSAWYKQLVMESYWLDGQTSAVLDPQDEWWRVAKYIPGSKIMEVRTNRGVIINPLDHRLIKQSDDDSLPSSDNSFIDKNNPYEYIQIIVIGLAENQLNRELMIIEKTALIACIERLMNGLDGAPGQPVLEDLVKAIANPSAGLAFKLNRIGQEGRARLRDELDSVMLALWQYTQGDSQGLVNGPTTEGLLEDKSNLLVIKLANLDKKLKGVAMMLLNFMSSAAGFRYDRWVIDEFTDAVDAPGLVPSIQRRQKASRKRNERTGLIMHSFQSIVRSSDNARIEDLLADSDISLFFTTNPKELEPNMESFGLRSDQLYQIGNLEKRQALMRLGPGDFSIEVFPDLPEELRDMVETSHDVLGIPDLPRNLDLMPVVTGGAYTGRYGQ